MFIACDFCVLTFEFYVVRFPFCVLCFGDSDFPFRSTANLQIPERRKKCVLSDRKRNANNVVSYAVLAHPSHMQFLLKSQNTKVTNTQLKKYYSKHSVT